MINNIINTKYPLFWTVLHLLLGVLVSNSTTVLYVWFFGILAVETPKLLAAKKGLNIQLNYFITYIVSFEMLCRMARTSPIIPYEMSKYILFVLFAYGIMMRYSKGNIGWLMFLLLIPALFYDDSESINTENLIFNVMGGLDLALGVIYFKGQSITKEQLLNMLKLCVYPLLAVLSFVVIRTPEYDDIAFDLSANFDTSGGFGSNQVSTALGLGLFILVVFWLIGKEFTGNRILELGLILGFFFQGLLTFSRGGVTGAVIACLALVFLISFSGGRKMSTKINLQQIAVYLIPIVILGILVFQAVDSITGNNLTLRYKGETAGTRAGSKEVSLNTLTTNRYAIFLGDLELWEENILLGVGAGASKDLRPTTEEVPTAAHVELSRLLAEHGLFGLFYFILILLIPFTVWRSNPDPLYRSILIAIYILGLYTSFHAAMRTYITPLLISMSLIVVKETVPTLRKKIELNIDKLSLSNYIK